MALERMALDDTPVRVLAINGSPRKNSNSGILLEKALGTLIEQKNVEIQKLYIWDKHYDQADQQDDFDELLEKWRWADAVILSMPVYTAAGPGLLYNAVDRLAEALEPDIRKGEYKKAAGFIMQGSETWGMVELGLENIIDVFASLHCIPVYRLAGRVPDKQPPEDLRLLNGALELGRQVVEIARMLKLGYQQPPVSSANILVLNAGVNDSEIGDKITERVQARLLALPGITAETYRFAGKKIEGCHHCNTYCGKHLECAYKDGFQEFRDKWLRADGLIWICSADYIGPPAIVRCALDRLSETGFSTVMDRFLTQGIPYAFAKYTRPEGSVVYGRKRYGGQQEIQQFFFNHAVLRSNLPVTGSDPNSPLGPAAFLRSASQLGCDQTFTEAVDLFTKDIADLARRVLTAKFAAFESISENYFPSRNRMGITDKEAYRNE